MNSKIKQMYVQARQSYSESMSRKSSDSNDEQVTVTLPRQVSPSIVNQKQRTSFYSTADKTLKVKSIPSPEPVSGKVSKLKVVDDVKYAEVKPLEFPHNPLEIDFNRRIKEEPEKVTYKDLEAVIKADTMSAASIPSPTLQKSINTQSAVDILTKKSPTLANNS